MKCTIKYICDIIKKPDKSSSGNFKIPQMSATGHRERADNRNHTLTNYDRNGENNDLLHSSSAATNKKLKTKEIAQVDTIHWQINLQISGNTLT